ncbi:hypothetical protein [uncultured Tateyamaria sp.]|uniref:hypothetical protein n=1 Tax=uncultured Tateyamaria sp. TaxID=455651 RepID=UPI00263555CF|nr:hypothetical protein [uncultured Tateyamaria sp.]
MIVDVAAPQGQWVKVSEGPVSVFWNLGYIRFHIGEVPPTDEFVSVTLHAQGQPRSFTFNGVEPLWIMSPVSEGSVKAIQISTSELFLVDADGNVLLDGGA